jgi:hypothetical protein
MDYNGFVLKDGNVPTTKIACTKSNCKQKFTNIVMCPTPRTTTGSLLTGTHSSDTRDSSSVSMFSSIMASKFAIQSINLLIQKTILCGSLTHRTANRKWSDIYYRAHSIMGKGDHRVTTLESHLSRATIRKFYI